MREADSLFAKLAIFAVEEKDIMVTNWMEVSFPAGRRGRTANRANQANGALLAQVPNLIDPRRSQGMREADSLFAKFAIFAVEKRHHGYKLDCSVLSCRTQRKDRESGESSEWDLAAQVPACRT